MIKESLELIGLKVDGVIGSFNKLKKVKLIDKPLIVAQSFNGNRNGDLVLSILITIKATETNSLYVVIESIIKSLLSVSDLTLNNGDFLSGTDGAYCQLVYNYKVNLLDNSLSVNKQILTGHNENYGVM